MKGNMIDDLGWLDLYFLKPPKSVVKFRILGL